MHIVYVVAFLAESEYSKIAGMPRYVVKIASLMKKSGHTVEIVTGATNNRVWEYEDLVVFNCQWYGEMRGSFFNVSNSILKRERAIQKTLKKIDEKNHIDVVQYASWSGIGLGHKLDCPAVLRLSTYSRIQYKETSIYGKNVYTYSFWEKIAGRHADGIIGPSRILLDEFGKDVNRETELIETPFQFFGESDDSIMKEYGLDSSKYLLFVGTLSEDKGIITIIKMIYRLFEAYPDIQIVLAGWDTKIGNESAVNKLKNAAKEKKDRVIYLGAISQKQLLPIIKNALAVLIPSIMDNLPNAGIEAICMDKLVVGTFGTSIEQIVEDGGNGFLTIPGDSLSLLEGIKKVLNLSDEEKELFYKKNQVIKEKYMPVNAVRKLETYYEKLLHR